MPSPAVRVVGNTNGTHSFPYLAPTASVTIGAGLVSIGDLLIVSISSDSGDGANWGGLSGSGWTRFINVDAGNGKPKIRAWWKINDTTASQTYSATWSDGVNWAQVAYWQAWQTGTFNASFPIGGAIGHVLSAGKATPYPTTASTLYASPVGTGDRVQQSIWSLGNGGTAPGWGTRPSGWNQTCNRESGGNFNSQYGAYRFLTPGSSNSAVAAQDFPVTTNGATVRPYANAVYYINAPAPVVDARSGIGQAKLGPKTSGTGSQRAVSPAKALIGLSGRAAGGKRGSGTGSTPAAGLSAWAAGKKGATGPGLAKVGLRSSSRHPVEAPVFNARPLPEDPLPLAQSRYLVQNILTGEWLHQDLPLTDDKVTLTLSGPCQIEGKITPEIADLQVTTTQMVSTPHITPVQTPVYTQVAVPNSDSTTLSPTVEPVTLTADKDPVAVLRQYGIGFPEVIVQAANIVGINLARAVTMVQKETNGRMVWGHDGVSTGGTYTKGGPVTLANYWAYRKAYKARTAGSQGCGICQLTYHAFYDQAEAMNRNAGASDPLTNCRVGFAELKRLQATYGVQQGARRYNGSGSAAEAYAADYMSKLSTWTARLSGTTTTVTPAPPPPSAGVPAPPVTPTPPPSSGVPKPPVPPPAPPSVPDPTSPPAPPSTTTRTVITYETRNIVTYTTEEVVSSQPLLRSWGHVIYLEIDGQIRAAGLITEDSYDDQTQTVMCQGVSAYPANVTYGDNYRRYFADPLTVVQQMWSYIQSFPNGNLGVEVTRTASVPTALYGAKVNPVPGDNIAGVKIAPTDSNNTSDDQAIYPVQPSTCVPQVFAALQAAGFKGRALIDPSKPATEPGNVAPAGTIFVNKAGLERAYTDFFLSRQAPRTLADPPDKTASFMVDPYKVDWWDVKKVGDVVNDAVKACPADYVEQYQWNEPHSFVEQTIQLAYPRIGRQRDDLRFASGENIVSEPKLDNISDRFANAVIGIGAGEGSEALRETAEAVLPGRVRKTYVYQNASITDRTVLRRIVADELAKRSVDGYEIGTIQVLADHVNAVFGTYNVGDDLYLQVETPHFGWVRQWGRITSMTLARTAGLVEINLRRSDSFYYGRENVTGGASGSFETFGPVLVSTMPVYGETTGALTTATFTPAAGEVLVVKAVTSNSTNTIDAVSGGDLLYNLRGSVIQTGYCQARLWTATVGNNPAPMTVTVTTGGTAASPGLIVERWRNAMV